MEVLSEVSVTFLNTKNFIAKNLDKKCTIQNISVEEVICFSLFGLIANQNLFLALKVVVFSFILIYGLLCNKKSCKATNLERKS